MKRLRVAVVVLLLVAIAAPLFAEAGTVRWENRLKQYFNRLVQRVEEAEDPAEKREILNSSLEHFLTATERMKKMPWFDQEQREALSKFEAEVREKHDELNGLAGFPRVADADLDAYAQYMAQDLEQAQRTYFVISGAALIIIILLLIIIL